MDYAALIEEAKAGRSEAGLAREIGIAPPLLNEIKKGVKPCPSWVVVYLAELAGRNSTRALFEHERDCASTESARALWSKLLRRLR